MSPLSKVSLGSNPQNENTDSTSVLSWRDGERKLGALVSKKGLIRCMKGVS